MEFVIIIVISLMFLVILGYIFGYNINKLKNIGKNKELDELSKKYPDNITLCKDYLKKLNNVNVEIEESKDAKSSLYIAITNKIYIANITNTYTRIQTLAHECLHSVQDRKILLFNFIFSNIYLLYFIIICALAIFQKLENEMMFLTIFLILSMIYYMVRIYLENDAMIKAKYLAKEYMEEVKISTTDEIEKIVTGFDTINNLGIKCTNYHFFLMSIVKIIIYSIICYIR